MNEIIDRIEREAGVPGLVSILAERITPTDLQSLLLQGYRLRSGQLQAPAVLSSYEANRFVRPSVVSPAQILRWEQIAFSHLSRQFEALALSPICPLGTNSVVAQEEGDGWLEGTGWLDSLISLREDILQGDYRALYLAWLKTLEKNIARPEPPVKALASSEAPRAPERVLLPTVRRCTGPRLSGCCRR